MVDQRSNFNIFFMSNNRNGLIWLIEDDHDIRVAVRSSMEKERYEVLSAASGASAIKILKQYSPDLIILDMDMPIMNGEEFLKIKKAFDLDHFLKKIPQMIGRKLLVNSSFITRLFQLKILFLLQLQNSQLTPLNRSKELILPTSHQGSELEENKRALT